MKQDQISKGILSSLNYFLSIATLISVLIRIPNVVAEDPQSNPVKNPITIGAILPFSGELAAMGDAVRNGIELSLSKLTPEIRSQIRMVYEDDAFLPKNAVAAFTKLSSIDNAQVLIGFGSATGNAINRLSEEKSITFVSISSDPAVSAGKKFVFSFWVTPEKETELIIPEAKKRGYKRIARLTAIHDGAFAARTAFDAQNHDAFKIVLDEESVNDQKDFRPYFSKLKALGGVDAFLPLIFPSQLGVFARQAREMGFTQQFFGYEMFEDPNAIKLAQGALLGAWFATYGTGGPEFTKELTLKYPKSIIVGAPNGYDIIKIVGESLSKGHTTSAEIAEDFKTLKNFTGALGTYSATGDNRFGLPAALKVVTESGFEDMK